MMGEEEGRGPMATKIIKSILTGSISVSKLPSDRRQTKQRGRVSRIRHILNDTVKATMVVLDKESVVGTAVETGDHERRVSSVSFWSIPEDDVPHKKSTASVDKNQTAFSSSSQRSNTSSTGSESVTTTSTPSLGERLMRTQKHRDPLRYYEVVKSLGNGSMGRVCKVRKKTFGGSARSNFVQDEKNNAKSREAPQYRSLPFSCFLFCFPGGGQSDEYLKNNAFVPVDDDNRDEKSNQKISTQERKEQYQQRKPSSSSSKMISFGSSVSVDFALKSIILEKCRDATFRDELLHEIAMLRKLDHPNIVRALETYDYDNSIYLVLELCNGGDLYTRDPYTERQACTITYALLDAVAYLHSKHITHRDLKFENIMFASPSSSTDFFRLSKKYGKAEDESSLATMTEIVGTIITMAPEVLNVIDGYDEKCDCWSMGVIAFMLLSSSLPFFGNTPPEIAEKIKRGQWSFTRKKWGSKSKESRSFIRTMLMQDSKDRPSATQAMENPWFEMIKGKENQEDDHYDEPISLDVMDRVQATIQTFAGYSHLKKLALLVVAHQSIDEEIGYLRRLFLQRFDTDKASANVSYPEFKDALMEYYDYTEKELSNMFTGIDIDGTGKISFTEFLAASIEAHGMIEEERIAEAFDRIDCDDSGYITVENLKDMLGDEVTDDFLNEILDEVKADTIDKHITYEDFLGLWDSDCDEKLQLALAEVQIRRRRNADSSANSSAPMGLADCRDDTKATEFKNADQYVKDTDTEDDQSMLAREKAKSVRSFLNFEQ